MVNRWRVNKEKADPAGEVVEVASYEGGSRCPMSNEEGPHRFRSSYDEDPHHQVLAQPGLLLTSRSCPGRDKPREPGVPRGLRWRPVGTFLNVGWDLVQQHRRGARSLRVAGT